MPTEEDWRSADWDLDVDCAYEHFYGKTVQEAERLFQKDSANYQEDLMFMPGVCLPYYLQAFMQYLVSTHSEGDADGAAGFISLITSRVQDTPEDLEPILPAVAFALRYVADHQDFYEASEEVYGSFHEQVQALADHGLSTDDESGWDEADAEVEDEEEEV